MTAHGPARVTTDGSCVSGLKGERGAGGWCAIVEGAEHGSDGVVLRGRAQGTTSTQMELKAVLEGLKALPDGREVELVFDCTTILMAYDRWQRGELPVLVDGRMRLPRRDPNLRMPRDVAYWVGLGREFSRLRVTPRLLESVRDRRGAYAAYKHAAERGWKREARELRRAATDELSARGYDLLDAGPVREAP